ncbi:2-amino-4-hydroxy-6-hydroxymethyldihydropteridine diphosphokinase [Desulfuribacillus stibiiarsenatis]|uniref:2-amino-4-hydroxy-6-hydroxymethyldihydropteridine diphosphokinase n=1 Tax=Desulfuribacillus stibiiarsenatis TaxID=1390249 RepID=A0A1E5L2Q6_9FIRM|nr:2-amino-4-hydroxy-6-hydroxymethyldihydropteridine diphosphokinase [Desulfuribacillus stibiiarsenatis]OEH84377.1 2-amino-4-hydroxy-6-hydroxymethyldihydropteridine diphosphokinase [Desulfuribacillus stibiiarsenatis]
MQLVYLGLGSNIEDRLCYIRSAIQKIDNLPHTRVVEMAPIYVSEPWGVKEQTDFLNTVIAVETTITPEELLCLLQDIEKMLGRIKEYHWGPRTIDIDILLYEDCIIDTDVLVVPHPHMLERNFVLVPLSVLNPSKVIPGCREPINILAQRCGNVGLYEWEGDKID